MRSYGAMARAWHLVCVNGRRKGEFIGDWRPRELVHRARGQEGPWRTRRGGAVEASGPGQTRALQPPL